MKRQIIGLALGLALLGAGSAQALVIDNFTTDQTALLIPVGASADSNTVGSPDGSIADNGGSRTMSHTTTAGLGGVVQIIGAGLGFFNLSANATTFTTVEVEWLAPGPVDLTDGGTSQFLIFGVDSLDHPLTVTVELEDGDGDVGANTYYKHNTQVGVGPDPVGLFCDSDTTVDGECPQVIGSIYGNPLAGMFGNYYHALSSFTGALPTIDPATGAAFGGNGLLNLTDIVRVTFSLTTSGDGLDFLVDCLYTGSRVSTGTESFGGQTLPTFDAPEDGARNACPAGQVVPEPASLLLMGTGLLGVGLVGLRTRMIRRRQQA